MDSHREKTTKLSLNMCFSNHISISPNFNRHRSLISENISHPVTLPNNKLSISQKNDRTLQLNKKTNSDDNDDEVFLGSTTRSKLKLHSKINENNKDNCFEDIYRPKSTLNFYSNSKEISTNSNSNNNSPYLNCTSGTFNFSNQNQQKIYELLTGNYDIKYIKEKDLKNYLTRPLEKNIWFKCKIERKVIDKKIIKFNMTMNDNENLLFTAIKKPKKSYTMYLKQECSQVNEEAYLGKVKSNFFGTEFNTYDSGKKIGKEKNKDLIRANLASINYVRI